MMNIDKAVGLILGLAGLGYALKSDATTATNNVTNNHNQSDSGLINYLNNDFDKLFDTGDKLADEITDDSYFGADITPVAKPAIFGSDITPISKPTDDRFVNANDIKAIAKRIILNHNFKYIGSLDEYARFILAMAKTESSLQKYAVRQEPDGRKSYGLMQVLRVVAKWLYDDMGYRSYSLQSFANFDIEASIYFGLAYNDWVIKRYQRNNNSLPSWQFVAESYNGGYGNSNSMTQNHWRKIQQNWEK